MGSVFGRLLAAGLLIASVRLEFEGADGDQVFVVEACFVSFYYLLFASRGGFGA